jgi:hypothetical protein
LDRKNNGYKKKDRQWATNHYTDSTDNELQTTTQTVQTMSYKPLHRQYRQWATNHYTDSTDNELQTTTQKSKNWATRSPQKTVVELRFSGRETVFAPLVTSVRPVILFTYPGLSLDWRKSEIVIVF